MQKTPEIEEINAEAVNDGHKKPELRLITGGRGPSGPDWLSSLSPGTTFLVRPKTGSDGNTYNGFTLLEFYTAGWFGKARVVVENSWEGVQRPFTVDSRRFSDTMELFDVVSTVQHDEDKQEEPASEADGDKND